MKNYFELVKKIEIPKQRFLNLYVLTYDFEICKFYNFHFIKKIRQNFAVERYQWLRKIQGILLGETKLRKVLYNTLKIRKKSEMNRKLSQVDQQYLRIYFN